MEIVEVLEKSHEIFIALTFKFSKICFFIWIITFCNKQGH